MGTQDTGAAPRHEARDGDNLPFTVLLEEYRLLSSSIERLSNIPFTSLPVIAAIAVIFAAFGTEKSGLSGLAAAYALAAAVAWMAFIHSMVCGFGLRLVRIELLINRASKAGDDEIACWYAIGAGAGGRQFPGYRFAVVCMSVLGGAVIAMSLYGSYSSLQEQLHFPPWISIAIIVLPVISTITLLVRMRFAEAEVNRKKTRLYERSGFSLECDFDESTVHRKPLDTCPDGSANK